MSYWSEADNWGVGHPVSYKAVKCWEKHPTYFIDGMPITGGSCTSNYPDVDVFIGLDWNAKTGRRSYPWVAGTDIFFKIADMGVPENLVEFKHLLQYTKEALYSGKSVYVGCIGGHGRTGLFLAALTTYMTGDNDSIVKVRNQYCKKAVESTQQIDWLHKHFSINKVKASKHHGKSSVLSLPKNKFKTKVKDEEPFLASTAGVTEAPKAKYHCILGKSVFVND